MKTVYRKDIRLSHMARLLRRSFACAPFSAGDLSGEVALVRMEEVRAPLVVKHGETGVRVAGAGFFWLEAAPRARHWWLTAALDENGGIVQYYFDITLENDIRPGGQSSFLDLFLDVVLSPGGDVYILDRDELAAALSAGEISPAQYALALREAEALARALPAREGELAAFCRTWFARLREQLAPEG